jgi:RNA polymerase sigma factor (TIGR02999 family)
VSKTSEARENPETRHITALLNEMQCGDRKAGEKAAALVYGELKRIASRQLHRERPGHTLITAGLVNEAYLRLSGGEPVPIRNRGHFFAIASQQMRRVLVDHARAKSAERRGGGAVSVGLDQANGASNSLTRTTHSLSASPPDFDVLSLHEALEELEAVDPRAAQVVELRYFGGYTDKEVGEALSVPFATVRRDWEFARCWLADRLKNRARPAAKET